MPPPILYIVGGPNGAGKSTFAGEFLVERSLDYLCTDAIAVELSPSNPAHAQVEAGREFLRRLAEALDAKRACLVESTLSGRSLVQRLHKARGLGYSIQIEFVFLDTAESSLARVRERVRKGGHNVPEADVRRRFVRTIRNFWRLYRPAADQWHVVYNESGQWRGVAAGTPVAHEVIDPQIFAKFLAIAEAEHD